MNDEIPIQDIKKNNSEETHKQNIKSCGSPFKKWGAVFLRILVSGVLLWVLFKTMDLEKVRDSLMSVNIFYFILANIAFSSSIFIATLSWIFLLKPLYGDVNFWYIIKLRLISTFFNISMPSGIIGDLWRGYIYGKEKENLGSSFASVMVDKWSSFISLAVFGLAGLIMGGEDFKRMNIYQPIFYFTALMWMSIILSMVLLPFIIKYGDKFLSLKGKKNPWFVGIKSLDIYTKDPTPVLYSIIITLLSPVFSVLAFQLAGLSLGADIPLYAYAIFVPLIRVINHIPLSVNSVGTQDVAIIFIFSQYGVSPEVCFSLSILTHLLKLTVSFGGGILYLSGKASEDKTQSK